MDISACGLKCTECQFFNNPCAGCYKVEGKTFWALEAMPKKVCTLYNCAVQERKYKSCGECIELPCKKFKDLKDPKITEEQHLAGIDKRVDLLKSK